MPFSEALVNDQYSLKGYEPMQAPTGKKMTFFPKNAWKKIAKILAETDRALTGYEQMLEELGTSDQVMKIVSEERCQLFGAIAFTTCQKLLKNNKNGKFYCTKKCSKRAKKATKGKCCKRIKRNPSE